MKIGIECELNSDLYSLYNVLEEEMLSLDTFNIHQDIPGISVKMSEEYYRSTLEYNFEPIDSNSWEAIDKTVIFLSTQFERYGLNLNSSRPSFVGTHIHIFGDKYKRKRRKPVFKALLKFILDNIGDLEYKSLSRLYEGHQLWCRWDLQNGRVWSNNLKNKGMYTLSSDAYENYSQKSKYGPIIHSAANMYTGKPASFEIRFIPNELLFNKKIFKFLKSIEDGSYKNEAGVDENTFLDIVYARMRELSNRSSINRAILEKNVTDIFSLSLKTKSPRRMMLESRNNEEVVPDINEEVVTDFAVCYGSSDLISNTNIYYATDGIGNTYSMQISENRYIRNSSGDDIRALGIKPLGQDRFILYGNYIIDTICSVPIPFKPSKLHSLISLLRNINGLETINTIDFIQFISPVINFDRMNISEVSARVVGARNNVVNIQRPSVLPQLSQFESQIEIYNYILTNNERDTEANSEDSRRLYQQFEETFDSNT